MLAGGMDTVYGNPERYNTWSEDTDLVSVGWARFRPLTRRVHSIRHSEVGWSDFGIGTLSFEGMTTLAFALSSGTQNAFPHLRRLVWKTATHSTSLLQILLIIGPSLKVLDLNVVRGDRSMLNTALYKLLSALKSRQDVQLHEFCLRVGQPTARIEEALYAFLRTQQSLRFVDMDVRNIQAFIEGVHPASEETLMDVKLVAWERDENEDYTRLLKLHALESVHLDIPFTRQIVRSDIKRLGAEWPNLNCWRCAAISGGPADLVALAAQLPNLEVLEFDVTLEGPMPPPSQPIPHLARLRRLDALSGTELMDDEPEAANADVAALAELLTTLCPDTARIDWGTISDHRADDDFVWKRLEAEIDRIRSERQLT